MSDNNEPLDLQKIEARLAASKLAGREIRYMSAGEDPLIEIGFGPKPTKLENMTDLQEVFFINAPTDIAALLRLVRQLEGEKAARYTYGAKETKERVLSAIDMAGLMEAKFGSKDRARVIAEIKLLVQSIEVE